MRIVLNKCYGGFGLSKQAIEILGYGNGYYDGRRDDPALLALIDEKGEEWVSGYCADLGVVEIPDEATDWELDEYDGWETIIYVVNGKLYHA